METGRTVSVEATPAPLTIDLAKTAVLVIDMQNDFGSKGGMFDRVGIDVSVIQRAVGPTAQVIASAAAKARSPRPESSAEEAIALEFVQRAAAAIGANVLASSAEHEGVVTVTCTGADLGLFIGKHGQTIDAIQYLANAIARSQGGERGVVVDAAGYRARRTATLETMAKRTAQRASATGRRVELEPMTPVERKIVHEALKDDPEVETLSEGSEPNRYVVVLPRLTTG